MKNARLKNNLTKALKRKTRGIDQISTDLAADLLLSLVVDPKQTVRKKTLVGELRSIDKQIQSIRRRIKRAATILLGLTPMKGNTAAVKAMIGMECSCARMSRESV